MSRTRYAHLFIGAALLSSSGTSSADPLFSRGSVSLESRGFEPDDFEDTEDYSVALTTRVDIKFQPSRLNVALRGLFRLDALDDTRNIAILEEAFVAYGFGPLTFRLGSQLLNWTATEAFHPADILNSRNFDSDVESLEKLGEPMVEAQLRIFNGTLSVYYMPVRVTPNVVSSDSRLSFVPRAVELGDTLWIDRDGNRSEDWFANQAAAHLTQTIGRGDIALHVVDHSDRHQPTFTFDPQEQNVRPTYHSVTQFGLTYVHVFGGLLVKMEAAHRRFRKVDPSLIGDPVDDEDLEVSQQPDHEQVAGGVEYGWTTAGGGDATVIAEGQLVGPREDRESRRELHPFQADILFGYRHAFNDVQGREVVVAFITDVERPYEYVASLRYAQRLSDTWSVEGSLRSLSVLELNANAAQFTLTRNF